MPITHPYLLIVGDWSRALNEGRYKAILPGIVPERAGTSVPLAGVTDVERLTQKMQWWYTEEFGMLAARRSMDKQENTKLFQGAAWDRLAAGDGKIIRGLYCDAAASNHILSGRLREKLYREFRLDPFGNVVSPRAIQVGKGS